ncbi:DUF7220 family protein [Pseudomonas sp. SDO55104_S430]
MSQSRKGSAFEACINMVVGLIVSMIANSIVFPRFGFNPSLLDNIGITIIYTVISLVRSYCLRRAFNMLDRA